MLTIHHLQRSQSERIVWLCEELALPYRLVSYERDPVTRLAPPELRAVSPLGTAPVIQDGDLTLAESGAIVDYILARFGAGRLACAPDDPDFAAYLYWLHFANGTLQPAALRLTTLRRAETPADHPASLLVRGRLDLILRHLDERLAAVPHLAGAGFTTADIMTVFSLTTMRLFSPYEIAPYPAILAYLARIGARPAYRRALEAGDPGFAPMLS